MIHKTLHSKLRISLHDPHKPEVNVGAPEGKAVPVQLVKFVLHKTVLISYLLTSYPFMNTMVWEISVLHDIHILLHCKCCQMY